MDAFSYLSVLLSIILGLTITQVLESWRKLMLHRGGIILYAPPLIWSGLMPLFAIQSWWASFGLADHAHWTFASFAILLLQTALLYMMAAIVLPDPREDHVLDLRDHYDREIAPFFSLLIAMLATSLAKDWMIDGHLPGWGNLAFHFVLAGHAALGILIRAPLFHRLLAPAVAAGAVLYIALLFARI